MDIRIQLHREGVDGGMEVVLRRGANGTGRAGYKGHQCALYRSRGSGLVVDTRLIAVIAEALRRQLAAGVAVDAALIDVKISGDIFRES